MQVPSHIAHVSSVTRIKFNLRFSTKDEQGKGDYIVATCGQDHTVRVLKLTIN